MWRQVKLTNGGIKAEMTFFLNFKSVRVREIMPLQQEESVGTAKFDRRLFRTTGRHEAINPSCAGLGWGRI